MNIAFIMNDRRSVLSSVPPDFLKSMLISPVAALPSPEAAAITHCAVSEWLAIDF